MTLDCTIPPVLVSIRKYVQRLIASQGRHYTPKISIIIPDTCVVEHDINSAVTTADNTLALNEAHNDTDNDTDNCNHECIKISPTVLKRIVESWKQFLYEILPQKHRYATSILRQWATDILLLNSCVMFQSCIQVYGYGTGVLHTHCQSGSLFGEQELQCIVDCYGYAVLETDIVCAIIRECHLQHEFQHAIDQFPNHVSSTIRSHLAMYLNTYDDDTRNQSDCTIIESLHVDSVQNMRLPNDTLQSQSLSLSSCDVTQCHMMTMTHAIIHELVSCDNQRQLSLQSTYSQMLLGLCRSACDEMDVPIASEQSLCSFIYKRLPKMLIDNNLVSAILIALLRLTVSVESSHHRVTETHFSQQWTAWFYSCLDALQQMETHKRTKVYETVAKHIRNSSTQYDFEDIFQHETITILSHSQQTQAQAQTQATLELKPILTGMKPLCSLFHAEVSCYEINSFPKQTVYDIDDTIQLWMNQLVASEETSETTRIVDSSSSSSPSSSSSLSSLSSQSRVIMSLALCFPKKVCETLVYSCLVKGNPHVSILVQVLYETFPGILSFGSTQTHVFLDCILDIVKHTTTSLSSPAVSLRACARAVELLRTLLCIDESSSSCNVSYHLSVSCHTRRLILSHVFGPWLTRIVSWLTDDTHPDSIVECACSLIAHVCLPLCTDSLFQNDQDKHQDEHGYHDDEDSEYTDTGTDTDTDTVKPASVSITQRLGIVVESVSRLLTSRHRIQHTQNVRTLAIEILQQWTTYVCALLLHTTSSRQVTHTVNASHLSYNLASTCLEFARLESLQVLYSRDVYILHVSYLYDAITAAHQVMHIDTHDCRNWLKDEYDMWHNQWDYRMAFRLASCRHSCDCDQDIWQAAHMWIVSQHDIGSDTFVDACIETLLRGSRMENTQLLATVFDDWLDMSHDSLNVFACLLAQLVARLAMADCKRTSEIASCRTALLSIVIQLGEIHHVAVSTKQYARIFQLFALCCTAIQRLIVLAKQQEERQHPPYRCDTMATLKQDAIKGAVHSLFSMVSHTAGSLAEIYDCTHHTNPIQIRMNRHIDALGTVSSELAHDVHRLLSSKDMTTNV
jgi:hypothetical protein